VVDKFTKWIKVKPKTSIPAAKAVEFIREIMYWFGVPNNNITDNGTQLNAREFKIFLQMRALGTIVAPYHTHRVMVKPSDPTI
jgi:hypothetical protein